MANEIDVLSAEVVSSDAQVYADIHQRIEQLIELSGEDLSSAMIELKQALKHNPNACALMLPEDIGGIVSALQRVTGKYLEEKGKASTSSKKKASGSSKLPSLSDISKMTPEQQADLLSDL